MIASPHRERGTDGSEPLTLYLDLIKDHYNLSAQWRPGCDRVGGKSMGERERVAGTKKEKDCERGKRRSKRTRQSRPPYN